VHINLSIFELDELVRVFQHMLQHDKLHSVKQQLESLSREQLLVQEKVQDMAGGADMLDDKLKEF